MTRKLSRGTGTPPASTAAGSTGAHTGIARIRRMLGRPAIALLGLAGLAGCWVSPETGEGGSAGGAGGSGGGPPGAGSGETFGVLETAAPPGASGFVLRGTMPVPPGIFPREDGQVALSVLDHDGMVAPTQMEVVSRYPRAEDGADVVELLAHVHRPPGAAVGDRVRYLVVDNPHDRFELQPTSAIKELMDTPGSLLLVARDVFGHQYGLDLYDFQNAQTRAWWRTFRNGEVARTVRTHGSLTPQSASVGPPSGALPHLMGAHAYLTAWAGEDALSLDLRIHNGHSGLDKSDPVDDPLGDLYFESIELWVPKAWQVLHQVSDPAVGQPHTVSSWTALPLVKKRTDGKMHYMPEQAQFHRRLVVVPKGQTAEGRRVADQEGLAFCQPGIAPRTGNDYCSWFSRHTPRFFPQNHRLPDLDHVGADYIRDKHASDLAYLSHLMETGEVGNFPMINPAMGWAHPWGSSYQGMTGGSEIYIFDGIPTAWAASRDGYRHYQLVHSMYTDRQPDVLFNKDGEPTQLKQWIIDGPSFDYVHMLFFQVLIKNSHDPFGFDQSPSFQRDWVAQKGLKPDYQGALAAFMPIDFQHYTRATRSAKVLAWLGNDALSRDDLLMRAELLRLSYHMLPNGPGGGVIVSGMRADYDKVQEYPGMGFAFGRGEAWGLDAVNCAYAMGDPEWRDGIRPWYEDIADLVCQGQASCSGFIQSIISVKMLSGEFHVRQSIEQAITENALRGMLETVFRGADTGRTAQTEYVLEQTTSAMIGPMAWDSSIRGPWNYLAVGPKDKGQGTYCGGIPSGGGGNGADKFQVWSSFAYGYELTQDSRFLDRAAEALGGGDLHALVHASYLNNLENKAALLALVQDLY